MIAAEVERLEAERLRPVPPAPDEGPRWMADLRALIALLASLYEEDR